MSETCIKHIESYWKSKTTTSNEAFNNGNFEEALDGYKEALYRAEVLNKNYTDCIQANIPFIQVYIISCNNIANTYEELQQIEKAQNMLKRVVYYLLFFKGKKTINDDEIESELKRASLGYLNFSKKNNLDKAHEELFTKILNNRFMAS